MICLKLYYHINAILKKFFLKLIYRSKLNIEVGTTFRRNFTIFIEEDGKVEIGRKCFFNNDCSIFSRCGIKIGNYCIFGENVKIYDNNHIFCKNGLIKEQGYKNESINIGNNCWIASNCVILKGVKIGENSVISAGSIVNRDIPSDSIFINNNIKKIERK